jgi:chromosome partitioning protein
MNAKGGVGKSTVVMALAETLSVFHRKNVLVIDSDSQTSMSIMLMHMSRWEALEKGKQTLVDHLAATVLHQGQADWRKVVAPRVSDVEEADSVYLIPSHMELSLFEREITSRSRQSALAAEVHRLLGEAVQHFDVILVDCPPGISILTETWLRECDFYLPPTKADYLSVRGLAIIERYRDLVPSRRFAANLGVLVNQKDQRIRAEEEWHQWLLREPANRCFRQAVPRRAYIQRAADFDPSMRTYAAKYPGDAGDAMRAVAKELLARIAEAPVVVRAQEPAKPEVVTRPSPAQAKPVEPKSSIEAAAAVKRAVEASVATAKATAPATPPAESKQQAPAEAAAKPPLTPVQAAASAAAAAVSRAIQQRLSKGSRPGEPSS